MIFYIVAGMLALFLTWRHFAGPYRYQCLQCGGRLRHKPGCSMERD